MLKKVAVNQKEIYKLLNLKKYKEAIDYVGQIRNRIKVIAQLKVDKLIDFNIILEEERMSFLTIVEEDINNKLLEDADYILMDESYVKTLEEKVVKLRALSDRKRNISNH